MKDIINSMADNNKICEEKGDYVNSDGILICGKCQQPKEIKKEYPSGSGNIKKLSIFCECEKFKALEEEKQRIEVLNKMKINQLYEEGIPDHSYWQYNFEYDDYRNPKVSNLCKKYVEHWQKMQANHYGILFYGYTGGGKSFYACCIATALIKQIKPVLVSRLSDLVRNRNDHNEKDIYLKKYELIVLDDIGVENATQTAYNIIDDIYRYDIPLIVTTNLTPKELKSPDTLDKKRIYDRILEMCCITQIVDVNISRLEIAKNRQQEALKILNT